MNVAVAGATGYVGGRLVPRLIEDGHAVRCIVRDADKLKERPWVDQADVAIADVLEPADLSGSLEGIDVAYYLVHSMGSDRQFADADTAAAHNFAAEAQRAGVQKIIYLGGLGADDKSLSAHLASRHATGTTLASGSTPVLEFRAAVILGSGSVLLD